MTGQNIPRLLIVLLLGAGFALPGASPALAAPPANDDFANATVIGALPFDDIKNLVAASVEPNEPAPLCGFGAPSVTVWYAFTPATNDSLSARILMAPSQSVVAAYVGSSLEDLTEVGVRCFSGALTFRPEANTTYYFQAGIYFTGGPLQFHLEVTPPPVAGISLSHPEPSIFDTIQFFDGSYDPGEVGFETQVWDFGDGATGSGCCPTHRYAADGDYLVRLTVTTFDGRTASASHTLPVRTHDVAIARLSAPQAASAGQTRNISVEIRNSHYPEDVEVQLLKSTPGGYELIGFLRQSVPVRPSNRTTGFNFSYTFTPEDAKIGKVTFKAIAYLISARDALPADNEAISSPPTKVR